MSVSDRLQNQSFQRARRAGCDPSESKAQAIAVVDAYRLGRDAGSPLAEALAITSRELQAAYRQQERLVKVRDELLAALAQALGVTESEAWRIVSLDIEERE